MGFDCGVGHQIGGTVTWQKHGIMSPEGSLAVVAREILRKNGSDPTKDVNLVVMEGDEGDFRRCRRRLFKQRYSTRR